MHSRCCGTYSSSNISSNDTRFILRRDTSASNLQRCAVGSNICTNVWHFGDRRHTKCPITDLTLTPDYKRHNEKFFFWYLETPMCKTQIFFLFSSSFFVISPGRKQGISPMRSRYETRSFSVQEILFLRDRSKKIAILWGLDPPHPLNWKNYGTGLILVF